MGQKSHFLKAAGWPWTAGVCTTVLRRFLPEVNLVSYCHLSWTILHSTYSVLWKLYKTNPSMCTGKVSRSKAKPCGTCCTAVPRQCCWLCWSCTCMWYISSAVSPTELSVRITRFPVSLEVCDDREDEECLTEPSMFSGLEKNSKGIINFWTCLWSLIFFQSNKYLQLPAALGHSRCQTLLKNQTK